MSPEGSMPEIHLSEIGAPGAGGPEVSVIVAHLNQPGPLKELLASLFAQDFDMGRAEVVVVDNGSRALPRDVVAAFPGVRLAEEPAPGPGPARNRGVALSRAPLIAFTDADCKVAPDWLAGILARFAADPGLEVVGGDIRILVERPGRPSVAEAYECVYAFDQRDFIERQGFSVTANLAMRRATFERVGPLAGIEIAEDTDWGHRAAALGIFTRYAPDMVVYHPARRSMAELYAKWDRNISHHFRARATGAAGRAKWALKALAMAAVPLVELPRLLRSDRVEGPGARARAFRGLAAIQLYRSWRMLATLAAPAARTADTVWNRPKAG
jgi:GT2 family glycosyltransferase